MAGIRFPLIAYIAGSKSFQRSMSEEHEGRKGLPRIPFYSRTRTQTHFPHQQHNIPQLRNHYILPDMAPSSTTAETSPEASTNSSPSSAGVGAQCLLARHPTFTPSAFRTYYSTHHAALVLPYFLDYGVRYYAQVHNLRWSSAQAEAEGRELGVELGRWDAVAEAVFGGKRAPVIGHGDGSGDGDEGSAVAKRYYKTVILPDERVFLYDEALKHMRLLPAGSVVGERVEIIVDGEPVIEGWEWAWGRWAKVRREVEGDEDKRIEG